MGLSLEEIEQQTFINKRYLRAIEEERWKDLPEYSYTFGYVKNYGRLLNINKTLKTIFNKSYPDSSKKEPSHSVSIMNTLQTKTNFLKESHIPYHYRGYFYLTLFVNRI